MLRAYLNGLRSSQSGRSRCGRCHWRWNNLRNLWRKHGSLAHLFLHFHLQLLELGLLVDLIDVLHSVYIYALLLIISAPLLIQINFLINVFFRLFFQFLVLLDSLRHSMAKLVVNLVVHLILPLLVFFQFRFYSKFHPDTPHWGGVYWRWPYRRRPLLYARRITLIILNLRCGRYIKINFKPRLLFLFRHWGIILWRIILILLIDPFFPLWGWRLSSFQILFLLNLLKITIVSPFLVLLVLLDLYSFIINLAVSYHRPLQQTIVFIPLGAFGAFVASFKPRHCFFNVDLRRQKFIDVLLELIELIFCSSLFFLITVDCIWTPHEIFLPKHLILCNDRALFNWVGISESERVHHPFR